MTDAPADVVAVQRRLIKQQVSAALAHAEELKKACEELDTLLYAVRYFDDFQELHSDAVEAVYSATDDAQMPHLTNALTDLAAELA